MDKAIRHDLASRSRAGSAGELGGPIRQALFVAALALQSVCGAIVARAGDMAYVESLTGEAAQTAGGHETDLDLLDVLGEGAGLKVTNGELRLCHYGLHQFLMVQGPFEGQVTRTGLAAQKGEPAVASGQKCSEPVVSTVQGGIALRSLGQMHRVSLHPAIKLSNMGKLEIRSAGLTDSTKHQEVATFDTAIVRPQLEDGHTYQLVVEFADGSQRTLALRASASSNDAVVIVSIR
jgi:hypothetical protein